MDNHLILIHPPSGVVILSLGKYEFLAICPRVARIAADNPSFIHLINTLRISYPVVQILDQCPTFVYMNRYQSSSCYTAFQKNIGTYVPFLYHRFDSSNAFCLFPIHVFEMDFPTPTRSLYHRIQLATNGVNIPINGIRPLT